MEPTGQLVNVAPSAGGLDRDPRDLASHQFLRDGLESMLRKSGGNLTGGAFAGGVGPDGGTGLPGPGVPFIGGVLESPPFSGFRLLLISRNHTVRIRNRSGTC